MKMTYKLALKAALVAGLSFGLVQGYCDDNEVIGYKRTPSDKGTIIGEHFSHNGYKSFRYRGIPFAKPPVGEYRLRPPQEPDDFPGGELEAFDYKSPCLQKFFPGAASIGEEDCLYLNVWTPDDLKPGEKVPVMFWLYGGGNSTGAADNTITDLITWITFPGLDTAVKDILGALGWELFDAGVYDGHYLAGGRDVVVVTINNRMGPFGTLAHPSLGEGSGNFTFLDIKKALEWVQTNISEFGGDATNVTLFGESAGAYNTCAFMNMPSAEGLFHKAIMESQSCLSRTVAQAEKWGEHYAVNTGCDDATDIAACLRSAPAEDFIQLNFETETSVSLWPYLPMIDGDLFPEWFGDSIQGDEFNHVPVMIGNNLDEAFLPILSDGFMNCPLEANLAIFDEHLQAPIYQYRFEHNPFLPFIPVFHASETIYVFGTAADMFDNSQRETDIAKIATAYWTNFAKYGNPNGSGLAYWPSYNSSTRKYMRIKKRSQVGSGSVIKNPANCKAADIIGSIGLGEQIIFW